MAKDANYIYYNGEKLLFSDWTTMYEKARQIGNGEAYVRQLVHRKKRGKTQQPIEFVEIPELGLTLVKK